MKQMVFVANKETGHKSMLKEEKFQALGSTAVPPHPPQEKQHTGKTCTPTMDVVYTHTEAIKTAGLTPYLVQGITHKILLYCLWFHVFND
jgi:hypothetical protein